MYIISLTLIYRESYHPLKSLKIYFVKKVICLVEFLR